jgi:hypothetical protein
VEVRPERVEPELERRRDPEVPARAPEAPEELGLLGRARTDETSVGCHELHRQQVVDREPEVAMEPADAATEREPGDAGVADHADRADEAVRLRGDVELAEERPSVRDGGPCGRVHLDAAHGRQVDHDSAVDAAEPGGTVAAGLHLDLEVVVAGEAHGRRDLRRRRRLDDERGPAVVDRIPQPAGVVVRRIVGGKDFANGSAELLEMTRRERGSGLDHDDLLGDGRSG